MIAVQYRIHDIHARTIRIDGLAMNDGTMERCTLDDVAYTWYWA